jgi:hypothetical protein
MSNNTCISPSTQRGLGSDELSSMMAKRQRLQQGYTRNVVGRMTDGADVEHCSLSSCKQDGIYQMCGKWGRKGVVLRNKRQ